MEHLPNIDRQKKVMFNRIITALFLASFFILLLVFFNPIILGLVLTMIAILAFNEWINLMDIENSRKKIVLILFFLAMITLLYFSNYTLTNYINKIYLMFWVFISLDILLRLGLIKVVLQRLPVILAFFVMLSSWYLLLSFNISDATLMSNTQGLIFSYNVIEDNLKYYFIFLFVLVSFSDTAAYLIGKNFGSILLCPTISPKKTVEGFLSSIFFPIIISYIIFIYFLSFEALFSDFLFILICCIFASFGDLFISAIKRFYDVKDSGNILPGHGGILDRIDSYLAVIPVFQLWMFL